LPQRVCIRELTPTCKQPASSGQNQKLKFRQHSLSLEKCYPNLVNPNVLPPNNLMMKPLIAGIRNSPVRRHIPAVITGQSEAQGVLSRCYEKINHNPARILLAISLLYFALTFALGSMKLIWLDEFITLYISKLGSLRSILSALARGADPNPPLTYLLVLASRKLFGEGAIPLRLPAILASWAGLLALFSFLAKRVPPVYAAAGALFFMSTAAFDYSFEGRSYALMLGFCALSLLAWQRTIDGVHKFWAAAGLAFALAAGLSSNYFAVLAFFPIAAGELFRDWKLRRVERRVWIALLVAGSTLLLYLPLINKAVATFSPHAWNKVRLDVIADSYLEMVETILWPALAILAIGAFIWFRKRHRSVPRVLPDHELIAAFVLMAYPFIAYVVARIHGGMLSPRFVIPMCYGFAIAVTAVAYGLFNKRAWAGLVFVGVLLVWVFARQGVVARMYYDQRLALTRIIDTLPPASSIAVTDSLLILPLYYYAPRAIAADLYFPVDFDAIRKYKKEDSPEQNLWNGRDWIYPVPIISLDTFTAAHPDYLVAAPGNNWLLQKLVAEDRPARLLPIFTDTKDIQGFTPLSHGPVWFFAEGAFADIAPLDARILSPQPRNLDMQNAK
jgi:4-amino-4-deoxy-L-arabinose transferase-like glycosyltransferase